MKFREGLLPNETAALHARVGAEILSTIPAINVHRVRETRAQSTEALIMAYSNRPDVEYAEPNGIFHTLLVPNDPRFSEMYGLHNTGQTGGTSDADIDAPEAWEFNTGNQDIIVADIDTGVDYNHADLAANMWTNPGEIPGNGIDDDGNGFVDDVRGWNFVSNSNDPMDDHGHGTHTAGTIAAVGNNGIGVVGVAWRARIMPLKFIGSGGFGTFAAAASAIIYSADMGARLSSNSWGCGPSAACFSQVVDDAIGYANSKGSLFVVAAGNSSNNNDITTFYPCNSGYPNVICVAATDHNDLLASFSDYGATTVDLGAPGVKTLSTVPTFSCSLCDASGYKLLSGTSMATPHVSGAAALVLSHSPTLTTDQVKSVLMDTVDPIPALAGITVTGGRLNIANAMAALDLIPPTVSLTMPANGSILGGSVLITATASDNVGVKEVEFRLDPAGANVLLCTDNFSPYECEWDTTQYTDGSHILIARARDFSFNEADSSPVSVIVDNTPPTVSITSPSNGTTVTGTVTIQATATDANGIASVEFYVDMVLVCTDTLSPYECSWNTAAIPDGKHTLVAVAKDRASNITVSLPVTVTVGNQGGGGTGTISTTAGNGTGSYCGDGGQATSACLRYPEKITVDGAGNVYIADTNNNRIRKVTPAGIITTVAGNGTAGYSGDGGQATAAKLKSPRGVSIDSVGNLYIADTSNNRIRKVSASGIVTTVAGNGTAGFAGDGGAATAAKLNGPYDVFVDAVGNLYIADTTNQRIRKVSTAGTITTIAGSGTAGYSGDGGAATSAKLNNPRGVVVDGAGNLYIGDTANHRVRKVSNAGTISTVAGTGTAGYSGDGGPATSAKLFYPWDVDINSVGELYIADQFNNRIRMVSSSGIIATVAGNGTSGFSGDGGPATSAKINLPRGVAVVSGGFLIADTYNHRIRKVTGGGAPPTDVTPPTIVITYPLDGSTVNGNITVTATASDNVGLAKVEIYLNGVLQTTVYTSPIKWNWNTTLVSNGLHTLTAKAHDGAGNVATSAPVTVTVSNGPDLAISGISNPPPSVNAGGNFEGVATIKNIGGFASGSFLVQFYLSEDSIVNTADILLTGSTTVSGLNPGQSVTVIPTLKVPAGVASGVYFYGACADTANTVVEPNEGNNCSTATTTIRITRPDLIETSVSNPPNSIDFGKSFSMTDTVGNQGDGPAGTFIIQFFLSTDPQITTSDILLTGSRIAANLSPGQSSSGTSTVTVPDTVPLGTYFLGVCADPTNIILESNETNNCLAAATQITITGPDLVMTVVSGPASATTGQIITISNTVTNQGTGSTGIGFYVGLFLSTDSTITTDDLFLNQRFVDTLAAGASSSASTNVIIPSTVAPGTYFFGAIADINVFDHQITESDETNNARAGNTVAVTAGPDLVMTAVSGPSSAGTGQIITISNTVTNQGTGSTGFAFYVGLFLSTDSTITTDDISLGPRLASGAGGLAPGASDTANSTVTIPSTLAPGTYFFGAIADYTNTVAETNEMNNALAGNTVTVTP